MVKKIKSVPKGTTQSVATLVCPSGLSRSLPDELPSSWYNNIYTHININFSVFSKKILGFVGEIIGDVEKGEGGLKK